MNQSKIQRQIQAYVAKPETQASMLKTIKAAEETTETWTKPDQNRPCTK